MGGLGIGICLGIGFGFESMALVVGVAIGLLGDGGECCDCVAWWWRRVAEREMGKETEIR